MESRYIEFFYGDNNLLSMSRLLMFMAFFPSTYVVVATKDVDALGWFLGAYVLGYVGGKGVDAIGRKGVKDVDNS
jgi:hypothetical protein